jgi:hypothetical protein
MAQDRGTPLWISIPLIAIFLGGLGFAIYRYSQHEDPPQEEPPPAETTKGKGGKMPGPPPIPPPPRQPPKD